MDIKDIKELIITIDKTSIETVEIEQSDIKIMITKKSLKDSVVVRSSTGNMEEENRSMEVSVNEDNNPINNKQLKEDEDIFVVKSPIVGTFYAAPSPDSPAFASVGDKVEKGQTLCIIEAMKIMNEIECEVSGEVVEVLVEDEDIVEYGQPLMRVRR